MTDLIAYTEDELKTFDLLCETTASRDQVERICGRLKLRDFVKEHGRPKCDAMYAELDRRQKKARK